MSVVVCPKCRQRSFTWSVDEGDSNRLTDWYCSTCEYSAREDEREEGVCPRCGKKTFLLLKDQEDSYRYCTSCSLCETLPPEKS